MAKPDYIKEITYEIEAHTRPGRFVVPKEVLEPLGLSETDPIHLVIRDADNPGEILFDDNKNMKSGPEVYGPDIKAIVESKQRLRITASRTD